MSSIDKRRALEALLAQLQSDLESARASHRQTHDGVTHPESKPENDKDTRALEASYLARGQAQRVVDLEDALVRVSAVPLRTFEKDAPAAVGAVVAIDDGDTTLWYLLAPAGGGIKLCIDDTVLTVLTPSSPVGSALLGRRVGDDVDIRTPQGTRECLVAEVY